MNGNVIKIFVSYPHSLHPRHGTEGSEGSESPHRPECLNTPSAKKRCGEVD